jgi:hypothetical protein
MRKDLADHLRVVDATPGWSWRRAKRGGHVFITPPEGETIVTGWSSGDWRAMKNLRAHLRRAGLEV